LKLKYQIYLLLILFIATVAVFAGYFYLKGELLMFYLCEALFLLFIPLSFSLVNRAMLPMEFVENSQQLLAEKDLSIRIQISGLT
jgi:hypothetical protein